MKSNAMETVKQLLLTLFIFVASIGIGAIYHEEIIETLEHYNLSSYMQNKMLLQMSNIDVVKKFNNASTIQEADTVKGALSCLLPSIMDIEALQKKSHDQLLHLREIKLSEIQLTYENRVNKLSESGNYLLQKISNINPLKQLKVAKEQSEAGEEVSFVIKKLPTKVEINKVDPSLQSALKFAVLAKKNQIKLAYVEQVKRLIPQERPTIKLQARKINSIFKCPSPEFVVSKRKVIGIYYANEQQWLNGYMGWSVPQTINFMQVLIDKTGSVECYYNWPSPKEQGTNLWMTVKLSSDVMQKVQPFGTYWDVKKKTKNKSCTSGIDACAMSSKKIEQALEEKEDI